MRKMGRFCGLIASVTLAGAVVPATARAAADNFYAGKRILLVIGYGPGGGYDEYARVLARFMSEHIPGHPTIVAQNMPGAGSRTAANWLYNLAAKDGTVLATLGQNTPTDQLLGQPGVKFDCRKFNWIGNMVVVNNTLAVWHTTGVTTFAQATKRPLAIGATGASSPSVLYPQVSNNLLGTKFKIITGYPGGGAINIALERGEVDGRGSNSWASWKSTKPGWLRDKKINILFQVGLKKEPDLPNVPLWSDLAKTPEQREVLKVLSSAVAVGRPIIAPPGVPADRVKILRRAFEETMKSPDFLAAAAKQRMYLNPMSGAKLEKIVNKTLAISPKITAMIKKAIMLKNTEKLSKKP